MKWNNLQGLAYIVFNICSDTKFCPRLQNLGKWCNMLIRDGATLVRSSADVLEALAPLAEAAAPPQPELALDIAPPPPERRGLAETAALHQQILSRLGPSPLPEDQLIRDLAAPAAVIGPALVELELDGKINCAAGGMLTKELENLPQ